MPVIEKSRVRASTEKGFFFQLLEYWSRPWIEWQGMTLSFLCKTRELKVDFLHVCVNLMHCFSSVRTVLLNIMYIKQTS